jgi:hypothetical protein
MSQMPTAAISELREQLARLLDRRPPVRTIAELWPALTEWTTAPIAEVDRVRDGDGLLFEARNQRKTGLRRVTFQRQIFPGDQEEPEILGITVMFDTQDPLKLGSVWGCGGPPWSADELARHTLVQEVESLPGFAAASVWLEQIERLPEMIQLWNVPFQSLDSY